MPRKKEITRNTTYDKLVNIGKASEKAISNLKIEDLKDITNDPHVLNIITLKIIIHWSILIINKKLKERRKPNA